MSVGGSVYVFAIIGLKVAQSITWLAFLRNSMSRGDKLRNAGALLVCIILVGLGFHSSNDTLNHSFGLVTGLTVGLLKLIGFKAEISQTTKEVS